MTLAVSAILGSGGDGAKYGLVVPVEIETMIWTWVIFLLLFLVLRKLAWKPLLAAVEAREKKISDSLARAEEVQKAAAEIAQKQEAALAEAHAKAKTVLDEARVHAEDFRKRETEKARKESEEFLERAKKEIALEENRARDALRREVVDLTLEVSSRVLERTVGAEDDRRLAERLVGEVQARRMGSARN
ncbi:MAG TPA: F0F1 ATP synthase subunit B [Planctomycetota bacterium]|nr:F0F1 ATP synthase subunit B [Planctomycetota bacterium]